MRGIERVVRIASPAARYMKRSSDLTEKMESARTKAISENGRSDFEKRPLSSGIGVCVGGESSPPRDIFRVVFWWCERFPMHKSLITAVLKSYQARTSSV
jgi:hypothetical protein